MNAQERIGVYIAENGIRQSFVAQKSGIDLAVFNRIILGKRAMRADEYEKICIALHKQPYDFMCVS